MNYDQLCDDVRKKLHDIAGKAGYVEEKELHKLIDDYMDDAEDCEDEKSMSGSIEERLMDILFVKCIYKP